MSLCEHMGGPKAIQAVVDGFYKHVLADPKIKGYFEKIDMTKQSKKTADFITMAAGGPKPDYEFQMKKVHEHLGITKEQFDAAWVDFEKSLHEHKLDAKTVEEAKKVFYSVIGDVVTK